MDQPGAPTARPLWEQSNGKDEFARLVPPPQHMVLIGNFGTGCGVIVQLFGGLRYAVPLSDTPDHPRVDGVDLRPRGWQVAQDPLAALIAELPPPAPH